MPSSEMTREIRKLNHSMAPYKELVLILNRALLWEKPWHSTAILAGSSMVFTIIWLCNPNVVCIIAFMGIIATLLDYFLPPLLSFLFKRQVWSPQNEREYGDICTNVVLYRAKIKLFMIAYYKMRLTNPKMYFSITVFILCILTWLGGTVDNIFLTYIVTTFLLMVPGMERHGLLATISKPVSKLYIKMVENATLKEEGKIA